MKPRFKATAVHDTDTFFVEDTDCERWRMPRQACSLFMSRVDAENIADTLNKVWNKFQRNPT